MADEPILLFKKVFGALRPANKAAERALDALDDKPMRVRITRTTGNIKRNALYWSVLHIAAPLLSEAVEGGVFTAELLHRVLKDRYGLVTVLRLPSGDVVKDYDSTSFASMTEPERAAFIDWSITTLSAWLKCDVTTLRNEAEAA